MENYIAINIKPIYKTFNAVVNEWDIHRDYITTVYGNRLEVESGTWFLWVDSYLITSGNTRDLHGVHNKWYKDSDGGCNDVELDYTPVCNI